MPGWDSAALVFTDGYLKYQLYTGGRRQEFEGYIWETKEEEAAGIK